jgi:hypothetical protein
LFNGKIIALKNIRRVIMVETMKKNDEIKKKGNIMRPRHELTLTNQTHFDYPEYGRRLKLEWSGSTDRQDSLESELGLGKEDTKDSERTIDANFIVDIYREKDNGWIYSGQLTEHVSGKTASHEWYNLTIIVYNEKITFCKSNSLAPKLDTIRVFSKNEW